MRVSLSQWLNYSTSRALNGTTRPQDFPSSSCVLDCSRPPATSQVTRSRYRLLVRNFIAIYASLASNWHLLFFLLCAVCILSACLLGRWLRRGLRSAGGAFNTGSRSAGTLGTSAGSNDICEPVSTSSKSPSLDILTGAGSTRRKRSALTGFDAR